MIQPPPGRQSYAESQDLGSLVWVLDDLRKSLTGATNAIRRFVWDTKTSADRTTTDLDISDLQTAKRQFHQTAGALDMVGQQPLSKVLRAMEVLCQKFVQWPDACTDDAAQRVEHASRALVDYLEGLLKGSRASPVALFPQHRALMELAGAERIHPADLWPHDWQWVDVLVPDDVEPLHCCPALRGQMSDALLPILKTLDSSSAGQMGVLCAGLAAGESRTQIRSFWAVAAAFFEAMSLGCLPDDIYVRRTAASVIPQYALLAAQSAMPSERVTQDFLFFCAMVNLPKGHGLRMLGAVRSTFVLDQEPAIDYESSPFGRFDPAQLAQARKRIGAAAETWSALAGGDLVRLASVVEEFEAVRDAISKLHTENAALLAALCTAAGNTVRTAAPPRSAIAIEVATSILYLEAAYDDLDLASDSMEQRGNRLAARLQNVCTGGEAQPIELWMEQLYRRVSERQTMGTVTLELRAALAEIEKSLDRYHRNPTDLLALQAVPVHLGQMRGVFSVLGLDQAALAVLRMRSVVERILAPAIEPTVVVHDLAAKLVSSLSNLGFLIDMLTYQPTMAKELFVYDEVQGEFKLTMEREAAVVPALEDYAFHTQGTQGPIGIVASHDSRQAPQSPTELANTGVSAIELSEDDDLQDIFLSEARGVVGAGLLAVEALGHNTTNIAALTTLRRAFHTLKGSARMVGHHGFGDAAWAFEQLVNAGLAQQRPVDTPLVRLCDSALRAMATRIEAIASGQSVSWEVSDFRHSADSLRLEVASPPAPEPDGAANFVGLTEQAQELAIPGNEQVQQMPLPQMIEAFAATTIETRASFYLEANASIAAAAAPPVMIGVGKLQISAAFFQVFLNEACGWSKRLRSEIAEWNPEALEALPADAAALAHSLQGGSAAVGFASLSGLARAMEQALDHVKLLARGSMREKEVLLDASQEIARLLEAFAQKTLADVDPAIVHALKAILNPAPVTPMENQVAPAAPDTDGSERQLVVNLRTLNGVEAQLGGLSVSLPVPESLPESVIHVSLSEDQAQISIAVDRNLPIDAFRSTLRVPDQELEGEDLLDTELMPVFLEEGRELLPALSTSLRRWASEPGEEHLRAQALRILHTLKGSARLAGALRLGEQAHRMESVIEILGKGSVDTAELEPCLVQLDQLTVMFEVLELGDTQATQPTAAPLAASVHQPILLVGLDGRELTKSAVSYPPAPRTLVRQSVRVRAQILDRLIDQSGEVMISRSRVDGRVSQLRTTLGDLARNLERLRQQLRDLELQADLQMQSRLTQTQETAQPFDPLEFDRFTRVQEVSRMMAESVSDIEAVQRSLQSSVDGAHDDLFAQGRRAKELQHDLLRMRLIEFEGISDRLYGVVRQASKDAGKQIRLDIVGGSIEIDRGMLDRMTPAFEHLLRNAIAHGIETPAVRLALGKPAAGVLLIEVHQDGSDISVKFSDDGAGLQFEKIRARAIAANLLEPEQALSQSEAARLLFIPGFTTAEKVTELAGRGIGMDVVLSDVSAVGGRIETASEPGVGTSFTVVFPLTTAVTQVVMLRVGAVTIGVPANLLETVLRVPTPILTAAYADALMTDADRPALPFFWAGALLNVSSRSNEVAQRQHAVAVIRSAGQRVALHVDEVQGSREVVVKNLGPQLAGLPGLVGMSVLASGAVVLIYNPVALASLYGDAARQRQRSGEHLGGEWVPGQSVPEVSGSSAPHQAPLVLVVDDSITVRRVTQRLLTREGFRVALAMDGLQALELLRDERPVVVLSDIEMPRMDGLDLARHIRRDPVLAELPIIVISSRIAQKHRDHAAAQGVNHYLGKPYSESELIGLIRAYCVEPALA